jgi:aminoglycoside 3-N-acetyltransferase
MFTKEDIRNQLKEMNAPKNSVVLMHTSLKAIGETEGRAEGLLETLTEYFTEEGGLFLVPTHTWANLKYPDEITMDMSSCETCIGVFPSVALRHPSGVRSLHPTHSMVAFGKKAEEYVAGEEFIETSTSAKGCYGKLFDYDGYVLLVGVGQERNTYIHAVEEMLDVPFRLSENAVRTTIKLKNGEISERYIHHHAGIPHISERYVKYEPAFRHFGIVKDGKIGNADAMLISARKIKEVVELIRERSKGAELMSDFEPLDEALYK